MVINALREKNVQVIGDEKVRTIIEDVQAATEEDWGKEYLDYIIGVKIVKDVDEAISHINKYGSGHSEAIVTKSYDLSLIHIFRASINICIWFS